VAETFQRLLDASESSRKMSSRPKSKLDDVDFQDSIGSVSLSPMRQNRTCIDKTTAFGFGVPEMLQSRLGGSFDT